MCLVRRREVELALPETSGVIVPHGILEGMDENAERDLEAVPTPPETPVEVLSGEVVSDIPSSEFEPPLEFEVNYTGEWQPPKPGAKNAWRKGVRVEDGLPVMVYENGSVRKDDGTGHWIRSARRLDSESGRQAVEARWQKAREAAAKGMVEAYRESGMWTKAGNEIEYDAWSAIVKSRALIAMDAERGRDGTDAARAVGRWTGMTQEDKDGGGGGEGTIRIEITGKVALEALRMLQERNDDG